MKWQLFFFVVIGIQSGCAGSNWKLHNGPEEAAAHAATQIQMRQNSYSNVQPGDSSYTQYNSGYGR